MTLKTLVLRIPKNKKRPIRIKDPVDFEMFKSVIIKTIKDLNISNLSSIKDKYDFYVYNFEKIRKKRGSFYPSDFGFCPNRLSIKYFIDRGWDVEYAKKIISENQSKTSLKSFIKRYGDKNGRNKFNEYVDKKSKSFSTNYRKGNHKKFFRPSQKEFWEQKNMDPVKSMIDLYQQPSLIFHQNIKKNGGKWLTCRQINFWVERGYSHIDAAECIKKIQDTRSLEALIQKYGKKEGKDRFNKINEKWLKTMSNKSDEEKLRINLSKFKNNKFFSESSKKFFKILLDEMDRNGIDYGNARYAEKEYFIYDEKNKKINFYDFYSDKLNLIIEYNGILFHPNKYRLSESEWRSWKNSYTGETADEKYEKDQYKINLAKSHGFNIIEVWENETLSNSIYKILKFII